jgi:hypothetical protein
VRVDSSAADPPRALARVVFEVVGTTKADPNRLVFSLVTSVRALATALTQGLVEVGPKSQVLVRDRRSGRDLIEYDYGRDLAGALHHMSLLEAQLDEYTVDEFCRQLGLDRAPPPARSPIRRVLPVRGGEDATPECR